MITFVLVMFSDGSLSCLLFSNQTFFPSLILPFQPFPLSILFPIIHPFSLSLPLLSPFLFPSLSFFRPPFSGNLSPTLSPPPSPAHRPAFTELTTITARDHHVPGGHPLFGISLCPNASTLSPPSASILLPFPLPPFLFQRCPILLFSINKFSTSATTLF